MSCLTKICTYVGTCCIHLWIHHQCQRGPTCFPGLLGPLEWEASLWGKSNIEVGEERGEGLPHNFVLYDAGSHLPSPEIKSEKQERTSSRSCSCPHIAIELSEICGVRSTSGVS